MRPASYWRSSSDSVTPTNASLAARNGLLRLAVPAFQRRRLREELATRRQLLGHGLFEARLEDPVQRDRPVRPLQLAGEGEALGREPVALGRLLEGLVVELKHALVMSG